VKGRFERDAKYRDKSLNEARKVSKYVVNAKKAEKMLRFEEKKRSDRIEKISKKFNKNVK
jgi:hypothetical protein